MWGVGFIVLMSFGLFTGGERFVELAKQALQGVGDNEQYLGTVHWRERGVYVCLFEGAGERFVELAKQALQDMALLPHEQRHNFLRYEGLEYPETDIVDFEGRLAKIHMREVHRVPVFNFGGLPDLMGEGLTARMTMEHRDEADVGVFTSRAWRRMFDIRGPLVHELILEFFSTFRFGQAILDLDTPRTLQF
ncbi:hypothetical protein Tco_0223472 [Tanacetum coccineum]